MAIGEEPIHGTGLTTGDVIAEAVRRAGGGGSPQPGQPTRFMTLTYHHTGNEDGSSASATSGIAIPDSAIAEGTAWLVTAQFKVTAADPNFFCAGFAGANPGDADVRWHIYSKFGGNVVFKSGAGASDMPFAFNLSADPHSDEQFSPTAIILGSDQLIATFYGMSTNTPTDWKINVQLTPIVP